MAGVKSTDLSRSLVRRGYVRGSPDRRGGVFRMRALDGGSALRFGRRIRGAPEPAKIPQLVSPDLISNLGVLYAPSVGMKFVYPNLIDNSGFLYIPKVNQKVTPQLIDQSGTQFNIVIPTAQTVGAGLISQVGVLYTPTVNSQFVGTNLIDNSGQLFNPQIKLKVTANFIDQSGVLFAIQIGIVPELIDQSGVVYDVAITQGFIDISPALIDQTGVLYDAAVSLAQPNTIYPELIDRFGVLYTASVRQKTKPMIALIGRYAPTIEKTGRHTPTIRKKGTFVS